MDLGFRGFGCYPKLAFKMALVAHVAESDPNTAYMLILRQFLVCEAAKRPLKKRAKQPRKVLAKRLLYPLNAMYPQTVLIYKPNPQA